MAQTLITREMMGQVGTLNAANPGNLGSVNSGSWFTRRVGPYDATTNAPGWSADVREASFDANWNLALPQYLGAATTGAVSAWIRFTKFSSTQVANHGTIFLRNYDLLNALILNVVVQQNGDVLVGDTNSTILYGKAFALNIWYFVLLEFKNISAASVGYKLTVQPLGGLAKVLRDRTAGFNPGGAKQFGNPAFVNLESPAGAGFWDGRIGACGLYKIDAFGDGAQSPDLIPPVEKQNTWYLDTTSGNDGNDGISRQTAWLTDAKLATEVLNSGVLGSANPWKFTDGSFPPQPFDGGEFTSFNAAGKIVPNGDIVVIDTTGSSLLLNGAITIQGRAPGLHITSGGTDRADIWGFHIVPAVSWVKTAGRTNIYETTDTENFSVLWEIAPGTAAKDYWKSMVWYGHPIGATFAAVAASLDNTAGSFWTDGVKMYVHPFGNTAPGLDGKIYPRSRLLQSIGVSAFDVTGGDCMLSRLKVGGLCIVNSSVQDFPTGTNHYCFRINANNVKLFDCYGYNGAKHIIGSLGGTTNKGVFVEACQAEQGSIYTGGGGQTPFVAFADFSVDPALGGMTGYFKNCVCNQNEGIIGLISGTIDFPDPVWYNHSSGTGQQWLDIFVDGCNWPRNVMANLNNPVVNGITITNTRLGACNFDFATLSRCYFDYIGAVPNAGGTVKLTNCIFVPTITPGAAASRLNVQGTLTMQNCTIDLRNSTPSGKSAYFTRFAASTWTYKNNIFVTKPGQDVALLTDFLLTDTLVFVNNIYLLGPSDWVALNYNGSDRTFGQWQLAGFDSGSLNIDPILDANERPGTRLVNIPGVNLGVMADFSGTIYENRRSAGAYEYILVNCASLLSDVGCFACLPAGQLQLVELALLCKIANKQFGV